MRASYWCIEAPNLRNGQRGANEHGAAITYTVEEGRNGRDWWIHAAREGFRMRARAFA